MRLTLIGMSGAGKTYWSKKLEQKGFTRFCCDSFIEDKLDEELKHQGYSGGIRDVAKWMGQPFEKSYKKASEKYLYFEKQVLEEIIKTINNQFNNDIIIDTTGSVIYLHKQVLKKLTQYTQIVYLELPEERKKYMYELFLKDPKPVIWGKAFNIKKGESNMQALQRCYPELLEFRIKRYEKLSHLTLGYHQNLELHFLH